MATTFTPEQIAQILEEFFKTVGTRQYVGARYVPIFGRKDETSIEWDNTGTYEPLTIVLYQGNSYTSRQFVPVGVEITNQEFWALTGNYNAQVEQYRRETAAAREAAEAAQTDIDTLLPKSAFSANETVKDYVDAKAEACNLAFASAAEMQAASNLYDGAICHTNGFHASGDGGAAYYRIGTTGTANGMDILQCGNLFAYLVATEASITPEMLGAYADGIHDDSAVIQYAIDNDYSLVFSAKTYLIANSLVISKTYWNIDASNAVLEYTGDAYALYVTKTWNVVIKLGTVNATRGGCVHFFSSDTEDYCQYIEVIFSQFRALTDAVLGTHSGTGWVNEIHFYRGRVIAGQYGFHLLKPTGSTDNMNHWNFINIGIEGVNTGFYFENKGDGRISDCSFFGVRYNESFTYLFKSEGVCRYMTFIGSGMVNPATMDIGADSDLWKFYAPTLSQHAYAIVQRGKFVTCGLDVVTDGGIQIARNSDLNDFNYPCNAFVPSSTDAATLTNTPTSDAFRMVVYTVAGLYYDTSDYIYLIQEVKPNNSSVIYRRRVVKSGGTWNYYPWDRFIADNPMSEPVTETIDDGKTIFTYRYNGRYVEWTIYTDSVRHDTATQICTLPAALRPFRALVTPIVPWINSAVTGSDRNALRITNAGAVEIICPDQYLQGSGMYLVG